jgi:hypothetical protein
MLAASIRASRASTSLMPSRSGGRCESSQRRYVAVRCRSSKEFIYDQVRDGRLLAIRIARQLRFRPPDVDAFIDANARTGSEQ